VSYRFRVEQAGVPDYREVIEPLGLGDRLKLRAGPELVGRWKPGTAHHFYLDGVSTRPVEVTLEGTTFSTRIFSGASAEDYELALSFAGRVSRLYGRPIVSEEDVRFMPSERRHQYGRGWIDDHLRAIAKVILRMAASRRPDDPIVIDGTIRPFHIGPRIAQLIQETGQTDLDRAERLVDRIRALQYPEIPFAPSEATRLPDSEKLVTVTTLHPDTPVLVERVDVVAVEDDIPLHVPWVQVDALLGSAATWIDEWTVAVRAISGNRWSDVIDRAEDLVLDQEEVASHLTQNTIWSTQVTDAPTEYYRAAEPRASDVGPTDVRTWWKLWRDRRD
jgi:hypothetical protein